MSEFNKLFLVIKALSERQRNRAEADCFEAIARDAGIPFGKLTFYLDKLQQLGLIKYSIPQKYIRLTTFGKKQQQLFQE